VEMKKTLFKFYFIFMILSLGLFSCENKSVNRESVVPKNEERAIKRPYHHYYRFSNLC
jgi:hypothetical protein